MLVKNTLDDDDSDSDKYFSTCIIHREVLGTQRFGNPQEQTKRQHFRHE
jgi:hypothetical protein